jgi:hypothetical protein
MPLVDYARTRRPILDIDLDAAPSDRWHEVGRRQRTRLGRFLRDIEAMVHDVVDQNLPEAPRWVPGVLKTATATILRPLTIGLGRVTGKLATTIARAFGEDYTDEIRGLARGSGIPESKLFLANLIYDLNVGYEGFRGACSSYSTTIAGKPALFRNMDWDKPESTGRHTVMTRFHKGGGHYVGIAPLGCIGILSAMRPGAWAVTINQAPANGRPRLTQWPTMHRIRSACDASLTFPMLVRRISEYQTMTAFFAHVVGVEPRQQVVVESYADSFHQRRAATGRPLVQANHFVSSFGRHLNPSDEIDDEGNYWDTYERHDAIVRRLRGVRPRSLREGLAVMARSPVTHSATMNQMALCPATSEAIIKVRT